MALEIFQIEAYEIECPNVRDAKKISINLQNVPASDDGNKRQLMMISYAIYLTRL